MLGEDRVENNLFKKNERLKVMEETTNLVNAVSIKERISNLSPIYKNEELSNDEFNCWCDQKSLCCQEDIEAYLELLKIGKKNFKVGIKTLSKEDKLVLYSYLKNENWFILNQLFFNQEEDSTSLLPESFLFALRFHLDYCKVYLRKIKSRKFQILENSYKIYEQFIQEDLLRIAIKTFVYDMHEQKKIKAFKGRTSKERFVFHLNKRFKNKKSITLFFEEYPVLCRLLSERVLFHLENFELFIKSLTESLEDISKTFNVNSPYQFSLCEVGASDSHSGGKTVTIFKLNGKKFVYKFKDLSIAQQWNLVLKLIEEKSDKVFYKVKRVVYDDFSIEEFIEYKTCNSHKDVENFYTRFGEYIAITYLLRGNDFHFENIIAHGSFPVLIDLETLFQNEIPILNREDIYLKAGKIKNDSILSTSLLPVDNDSARVAPNVSSEDLSSKCNSLSAFCGGGSKLPYKILSIVDWNTDNMRFEYKEQYSEKQKNIPSLKKNDINPFNFRNQVINGFISQYDFLLENKVDLANAIKKIFGKVKCRSLLRSTQQYSDMLDYGLHPSCMKNYLDREKLFENLWMYSFKNKEIISYEIQDLLQNDIPIFFLRSESKTLQSSHDVEIDNIFMESSIDLVLDRLSKLSRIHRSEQLVWLNTSLGKTCEKKYNYILEGCNEERLDLIVEIIINRFFTSKKDSDIAVYDFVGKNDKEDFALLSESFYDGLTGIYVFLLFYEYYISNIETKKILCILESKLFNIDNYQVTNFSVYEGKTSILTALYYKYQLVPNDKYIEKATFLIEQLILKYDELEYRFDWLSGVSGLIKIICGFYKICKQDIFLEYIDFFLKRLDITSIRLAGLSHGFSGVVIALNDARMLSSRFKSVSSKIQDCIVQERLLFNGKVWEDKRQYANFTTQWCHGAVGIGLARLFLLDSHFEDINLKNELNTCIEEVINKHLDDDCLCHGNMGSVLFLHECLGSRHVSLKKKNMIKQKIDIFFDCFKYCKIEGMQDYPKLGLMTGISGVGYGFLKICKKEVPNILTLN